MTDWTAGYVADIGYTYGYYTELNPLRLQLAFAQQGLVFPEVGTACELGFGQGLSANIHAAASMTQWHGTDFNPSQAGFARELAAASGSGAKLYDEAFADFSNRPDLPEFDYIGLHGIWSWISDENRTIIVDFIRRKLKVGGVLYISYNTLPGWAAFAPMRHLMTEHAEVLGAEGRGIVSRIDGAIDFAEKLLGTNPAFSRANPQVGDRLKMMKELSRHYLAHEYFNRDWHPMHFGTMAEWLEPAKLQYACSANLLDHVDVVNLTPEQQTFLNELPDPMFRQTVRDFMVNQQFRKDYWVKGVRKLSSYEKIDVLRQIRLILTTTRADVLLKVTGALGEAELHPDVYAPILDLMADHQPRTIGDLETLLGNTVSFAQLTQAVSVLTGAGHLSPVQKNSDAINETANSINTYLIKKAVMGSNDLSYLASPVLGGGVSVNRFQQMFLQSLLQGKLNPSDWAHDAWSIISAQGQHLMKEGKKLATSEENLAVLVEQANTFAEKQLPILRALQIA
jgi:SAM-dependent methyltransferase